MFDIQVANRQHALKIDNRRLRAVAASVLEAEGVAAADISIAVVGDATIRQLNRRYLGHDEPTDCLAFPLNEQGEPLAGEVVVSAETAVARAGSFGWSPHDELTLYVVHAALHLCGHDDRTPSAARRMQRRAERLLDELGIRQPRRTRGGARRRRARGTRTTRPSGCASIQQQR